MTNPGSPQGDRGLLRLPGVLLRVRPGCVGAAARPFNRPSAWWPGGGGRPAAPRAAPIGLAGQAVTRARLHFDRVCRRSRSRCGSCRSWRGDHSPLRIQYRRRCIDRADVDIDVWCLRDEMSRGDIDIRCQCEDHAAGGIDISRPRIQCRRRCIDHAGVDIMFYRVSEVFFVSVMIAPGQSEVSVRRG